MGFLDNVLDKQDDVVATPEPTIEPSSPDEPLPPIATEPITPAEPSPDDPACRPTRATRPPEDPSPELGLGCRT